MHWILLTFLSLNAFAQIDIVFDIDWTLVSNVDSYDSANSRVYESLGDHYRLSDGAQEIIEDLLDEKNIRISFYSGGSEARNLDLLNKIKLSNGDSLLDISYKVLSKKHLLEVSTDANLKFTQRLKKDLTLINRDLNNVVLIDDIQSFTPLSQRKNVIWTGKTFHFQDAFNHVDTDNFAKTELAWIKDRYKLYSSHSKIKDALEMVKNKKISFVDAINKSRSYPLRSAHRLSKKYNFLNKIKSSSDCLLIFGFK
jgi:hypothetical protein